MKYIVYSKDYCSYCKKAKELLANCGEKYEVIDMTTDPEGLKKIIEETKMQTVPQIFLESDDGKREFIGGFTELQEKFNNI